MPLRRSVQDHRLIANLAAIACLAVGCASGTMAVVSARGDADGPRSRIVSDATPSGRAESKLLVAAIALAKSVGLPHPHAEAVDRLLADGRRFRAQIRSRGGRERVFVLSDEWLVEERADTVLAWRGDMREAARILEMMLTHGRPR